MNFQNITAGAGATQIIQVKPEDLQPSFFKTSNYESYKDINPKRVPNTCLWFLEHQTFQEWKASSGDDLLWLSADPGCGKSVLSRALVDEKLVSAEPFTLCYFFFKDNEEQNNTATALCALLHQFFWAHDGLLAKHVAPAIKKCGEALKKDEKELWRTFVSAATDPAAGDVVCILDALDECQESDRNKLIGYLEGFYKRSESRFKQISKLKFLVTSRPYHDIEFGFSGLTQNIPTIRLAGEEESDKISHEIGIVIEANVKEIAERCRLSEHLRLSLQRKLCQIPNRTYLWLHLTLDEVRSRISKGKTEKRLLAIISTLSRTVEDAYEAILTNCDQEEARRILQIVVGARRPLTLDEIDVALEIEPDSTSYEDLDLQYEGRKESIRANCGLFISIVDSRVFLIHQTAREFLIRRNNVIYEPHRWKHSIDLEEAHRVLSEKCVAYLLFHELQQRSTTIAHGALLRSETEPSIQLLKEKHSFLDYSAKNWISHVQEAGISGTDWTSKTAKICDIGDASSCIWYSIYRESYFNMYSYHESRHTALYWAIVFGLVNETRFLLTHDSGGQSGQDSLDDILREAADNHKYGEHLVRLILDRRGDEVKITEQVVKAAAENWESGKDIMALLLGQYIHQFEISIGIIAAVARSFDEAAMSRLLEKRGDEVKITEQVVKAAAENWESGKDVMALLLEKRGDEVKITEQVVKAAAENEGSGKDVVALLLEKRGDEVKITEQVVKAAAENRRSGKDVMALLLEKRGDEVKITEQVVKAAALNSRSGKDVMALLLGQYIHQFEISIGIIAAVARSFDEAAMSRLLDQRGDEVKITEQVVKAAAENWESGKDVMALLLEKRGDEVKITEQVVKAAAENEESGKDVMALLLEKRGDEVKITEQVVKAAAENEGSGKDVVALLLEKRGDEVKITEQVVKAAALNSRSGKDVMALLLGQYIHQFEISIGIIAAVARSFDEAAMSRLLDQRGDEVKITEQVVKAAAENWESGKDIMALLLGQYIHQFEISIGIIAAVARLFDEAAMSRLLDQRGDEVKITEQVVKAAAENRRSGKDVMALLLEKRGDEVKITEQVVKAAALNRRSGKDVMALLLEKRGDEVKITEQVVKAAALNSRSGKDVMALLLGQYIHQFEISIGIIAVVARFFDEAAMSRLLEKRGDEVKITEQVVKAAALNSRSGKDVMALLLGQYIHQFEISIGIIAAVARLFDEAAMSRLLEKRGDEVKITEQVVKAAAENRRSGKDVMALLLEKRGDEVKITAEVVEAAASNPGGKAALEFLLERDPTLPITEEVVRAAASNRGGKAALEFLLERDPTLPITEEVVRAAASNRGGKAALEFLLERDPTLPITEEVVRAAASNRGGKAALEFLLERDPTLPITEEVVRAAACNLDGKAALEFLLERDPTLPITEEVIRAAACNLDRKAALEFLLERDPTLPITEEVVRAAACNLDGKAALEFLLERDPTLPITEEVVRAAACNLDGKAALEFLLEMDPTLPITEEVIRAAACNPGGKAAVEFLLNVHSDIPVSRELIASVNEEEVWTSLLRLPPLCFYDEKLSFMTDMKEDVVRNVKETKSFLKVNAVRG